jgi:predicted O-methyltransferase YrrM
MVDQPAAARPPYRRIEEIPGWFQRMDMELFKQLLDLTRDRLGGGDLAELGVYLGKSAALIGWGQQPGETFTVVDLFEQSAEEAANRSENDEQYTSLTQQAFERHYLSVHDRLPTVVRGLSSSIVDHATHGTHRLVHVDASHLYEHVVQDIASARTLLKPGGVVVFDDYRAPHTPGVAAAVWRATAEDLRPFALTANKLYAAFDDSQPWSDLVHGWVEQSFWRPEVQRIAGHDVVRLRKPAPRAARATEPANGPAPTPASTPASTSGERRPRRWWRSR